MTTRILTVGAWMSIGIGLVGVLAHTTGLVSNIATRIAAFAPYLMLVGLLGLILALLGRRWKTSIVAALVVFGSIATQLPLYVGQRDAQAADLVVMQANIRLGEGDIDSLADTVAERHVDVLAVTELTDEALSRIRESALPGRLPHAVTFPSTGGAGIGLFSRYPLSDGERLRGFRLANARATAELHDGSRIALYALHPIPPYPEPAWQWNGELANLSERLSSEQLPVVAAGDFNSTWDHRELRKLFSDYAGRPGMVDAGERTGSGMVATYPADRAFPALLALDRVMTRGGPVPVSLDRVDLPGSDHHGVVAGVRLSE